jgi:hypothetical protein
MYQEYFLHLNFNNHLPDLTLITLLHDRFVKFNTTQV